MPYRQPHRPAIAAGRFAPQGPLKEGLQAFTRPATHPVQKYRESMVRVAPVTRMEPSIHEDFK